MFSDSADLWIKPSTPGNHGKTCWRESESKLFGVMPMQGHCKGLESGQPREKTLALFLSAQLLNEDWQPMACGVGRPDIMNVHELREMKNDPHFSGRYRKIYNCKWAWKGKCER